MVYKVKIYTYKRLNNVITLRCGDEYLKGLKNDLFDKEQEFLDCENLIVPKTNIKKITIKQISDN